MNNKQRLIISVVTFLAFALMSVGFAAYHQRLNVTGVSTFTKNGKIAITNVTMLSSNNIQNPQTPTFTDDSINFNIDIRINNNNQLNREYNATYEITMENTSFYNYIFGSTAFTPTITTNSEGTVDTSFTLDGIEPGDIIASGESKTFTLELFLYPTAPGTYHIEGDAVIDTEQQEVEHSYSLIASMSNSASIDLRGNTTRDKVRVNVINTYPTSKSFVISTNNNKFTLENAAGNDLPSLSVAAESQGEYDIYIRRNNGVTFPSSPQRINLYFTPTDGTKTSIGSVSILVDIDETLIDDNPPIIDNVDAEIVYEEGKIKLTWSATDESGVDHFILEAYDDNDNLVKTVNTTNSTTNYTFTGMNEGTYYFKVYGVDTSRAANNGKTVATTCTTSEGYCSRSASSSFKWILSVTNNCSNCTFTGNNTVAIGNTYTARVAASNWYNLPNSITVTMGGTTLNASSYTYTQNNGNISIPNVTGDLNIRVTANFACLVKGTKILLANGKYKNIENITYEDLLAVWDFENGKITYEYPIWLEKKTVTNKYTKTTFSDGKNIKTVALHGMFSPTYNEFISINDENKYKVGTEILKIKDGKFKNVKITKIETIKEEVEFYHVVSTRYYNVIANDILTTDGTVILSNLYGFTKELTWPENRKTIMSSGVYTYDDFKDFLPYYMFKGMRVEEGKFLENYGFSKDLFRYYLMNNQVNDKMMRSVTTNSKGNRLWMVTTSKDNVNEFNKSNYLYEEGSNYKLPLISGKWYSTSENKYYKSGDTVKVLHGMHFIETK